MQPGLDLDISLAREIGEGSRVALDRVVNRHLGAVYRYVLSRLGPGQESMAATITQDTFDRAMRGMRRYPRGEKTVPMRLWLLRLASRQIARRRATPTGADFEETGDELTTLRATLAEMKEKEASALALALFEELPPDEIAATLGVSRHAAMRHLRKALRQVGEMQGEGPQDWSLDE